MEVSAMDERLVSGHPSVLSECCRLLVESLSSLLPENGTLGHGRAGTPASGLPSV
ncbi:hypothetical protein PHLCEN_2v7358 [Hermanssonia centrifuga]|uniref:Uncharacterized protein n=1 Tax=Hermanssonia centrifuga TaxID=98765 RepID=A0A2R6NWU3_9APHY|nr:hypothetical protein PHLCEN_2v7358 [Hermanssonia centrifuga]